MKRTRTRRHRRLQRQRAALGGRGRGIARHGRKGGRTGSSRPGKNKARRTGYRRPNPPGPSIYDLLTTYVDVRTR